MAGDKGNGNGTGNGRDLRIGIYICHCGLNIASKVDIEALAIHGRTLPGVVVSHAYKFMCSDPGQQLIRDDIAKHAVDRVVVASCSPLMHEPTFRKVLADAGMNPYFFQMANIREQVSWVTDDPEAATAKAKRLLSAAVRRVALHDALEKRRVPVNPDVLVVGGGIAGITAALVLADSGKRVHLVEREPSIGGHMAHFDKTFPTLDCAACILTPKMVSVDKHPNIHLMTYSEVEQVEGYVGNFTVRVRHKASYVDTTTCTGCGLCWETCPATRIPSKRVIRMGSLVVGETRPAQG